MWTASRRMLACGVIALTVGCTSSTEPASATQSDAFETIWSDFDANYSFFPMLDVDWSAVHAAYRDSIDRSSSSAQTAQYVAGMIRRLGDRHAMLFTPTQIYGYGTPPGDPHYNSSFLEARYFASPVRTTSSKRLQYTRLIDGTGYIYIPSFDGADWGEEIDQVLADLDGVAAIIIDIRNNGGGSEGIGIAIAARFYDKERVYRFGVFRNGPAHTDFGLPVPFVVRPSGSRSFAGPIALITNRRNGSAAEDFVLMISALPQAVTVGDTTEGVGSHHLTRTLPNGWTYWVPNSQQMTLSGFVYNFRGLPPTISVPWDTELLSSGREPYIEAALAELKRRGGVRQPEAK